jgi:hypothetical protein
MGIPVGLLGGATYLSLFAVSWLIGNKAHPILRRAALRVLLILVVMAAGAALWFIGLQLFVIGKICTYCLISHISGLLIAGLALSYMFWRMSLQAVQPFVPLGLGCLMLGVLIGGQIAFPPPTFVVEEYEPYVPENEPAVEGDFASPMSDDTFMSSPLEELAEEMPAGSAETEVVETASSSSPVSIDSSPAGSAMSASDNGPGPSDSDLSLSSNAPGDDWKVSDAESGTTHATSSSAHEVLRPNSSRMVRFLATQSPLDVYRYPHLGDPEAPHVIVEVMDYTCHHCRAMYPFLETARKLYGPEIALVLCPIANNSKCNIFIDHSHPAHANSCEYQHLALSVWFAAPEKFEAYHHWLMATEPVPSVDEATARAEELVLKGKLEQYRDDPLMIRMKGDNHRLWHEIGGSLPMLFIEGRKTGGVPTSEEEFLEALAKLIGKPGGLISP